MRLKLLKVRLPKVLVMSKKKRVSSEVKNRLIKERQEVTEQVKSYVEIRKWRRAKLFYFSLQILYGIIIILAILFSTEFGELYIPLVNLQIPLEWLLIMAVIPLYIGESLNHAHTRKTLRNSSKSICLFASVSAAESLEKGNFVDAGFFASVLFSTLKTFAESEKVKMEPWTPSLKKLFLGEVEKAWEQRSVISKTMMNEKNLHNEFSHHLYLLADRLFSLAHAPDYNNAYKSLEFIMQKSQKYWVEPAGFLEKHKRAANALSVVHDFLKITLVPIIFFILWLIFGYAK